VGNLDPIGRKSLFIDVFQHHAHNAAALRQAVLDVLNTAINRTDGEDYPTLRDTKCIISGEHPKPHLTATLLWLIQSDEEAEIGIRIDLEVDGGNGQVRRVPLLEYGS
jgi:hypothetical protein